MVTGAKTQSWMTAPGERVLTGRAIPALTWPPEGLGEGLGFALPAVVFLACLIRWTRFASIDVALRCHAIIYLPVLLVHGKYCTTTSSSTVYKAQRMKASD